MDKIVLATHNAGKLQEFSRMLEPLGIQVVSSAEAGFTDEVEETGATFEENAYLKANAIYQQTHLPTLADDSGLTVDALDGRPGVYSARYAGEHATDQENNQKLIRELAGKSERTAYYECAICFINAHGDVCYTHGRCQGSIGLEPKGSGGFGYDPYFVVGAKTMAEMSAQEKDAISHRGGALRAMLEVIKQQLGEQE